MSEIETSTEHLGAWRRIVDFPLVAMIAALGLYYLAILVSAIAAMLAPATRELTPLVKFDLIGGVVLILLYKLVVRHLGSSPRDDLRLDGALRPLATGLAVGAVIFALIVVAAAAGGAYQITGAGDLSNFPHELVVSALFPAISEEMLFRGIIQRWIEQIGGSWVGLVLSAMAFGFAHYFNPTATVVACLWIAAEAGILLGGAYMLTRSLWMPMGIHAAWNLTQGELFDVPVSGFEQHGLVQAQLSGPPLLSGGGFGLESSLFALVIGTSAGVVVVWLAVRKGQLVRPWWVGRPAPEA